MNSVRKISFCALYVAIIVALQTLLSSVNGLEFTTFLMCAASIFLPINYSLFISSSYCIIEGALFGFGDWVIVYLIYWSFVIITTYCLKTICLKSTIFTSLIIGIHSFLLGIFFAFEMLFLFGIESAYSYYMVGVPGDLIHLVISFIISLLLFPVFKRIMPKLTKYL